jgi:hypothetical protein
MRTAQQLSLAFGILLGVLAAPAGALDPTKCKAKINNADGVILVATKGVTGTLLWGEQAGKEMFPLFDNAGRCVNPDPTGCQLGGAGTPERLYPPEGCTIYLQDTGDSSSCSAYIKKCIPGLRPCPSDMVDAGSFCIDKYEASVWDSPTGAIQYGTLGDDYPCADSGQNCTNIFARSVAGVRPSAYVTWFQAQQACQNVGKRLPTSAEWQQSAAGAPDPGADNGTSTCNTASILDAANTGSRSACVSAAGAFDMVGNLFEFVADWTPRSTTCTGWGGFSNDDMCLAGAATSGTQPGALARGGGFGSAASAGPLTVNGDVAPTIANSVDGFRCAR